jgi:hypothetical protein
VVFRAARTKPPPSTLDDVLTPKRYAFDWFWQFEQPRRDLPSPLSIALEIVADGPSRALSLLAGTRNEIMEQRSARQH